MNTTLSRMELCVMIISAWKLLTLVANSSILDGVGLLTLHPQ